MLVRTFALIIIAVLFSGCRIVGTALEFIECGPDMCPGVYWVKEGGTRKQADEDSHQCWAIVRNEVQPTGLVSQEKIQEEIVPRYDKCMKNLGYAITNNPPAGWVKKWGKDETQPQ